MTARATAVADAYCRISGWFLGAVFCYQASLLLFLSEGLELSATQIGIILGVEMCLQFALEVPSGLVADEIGGGRTIRWALGFSILGCTLYVLLYLAQQSWPWQLDQPVILCVMCSLFVALGASLYSGSLERWVDESDDEHAQIVKQEGRAKSWTEMGKLLGGVAGFLCLAFADGESGLRHWMFAGPWIASLAVQIGILARYWRLLGKARPSAGRARPDQASLASRLVQRTRESSLLRLHPATDEEFLYTISIHAISSAGIFVVNMYFCVYLIDVFRGEGAEQAVSNTSPYVLVALAWAGSHFASVVGSLRAAGGGEPSVATNKYFDFVGLFVVGFVALATVDQPPEARLPAALGVFVVCRFVEGHLRVLQASTSRTLIKRRWGDEEGAFLSLEAWVRSIVGAVTLLAVGVAREFGGWPVAWAVGAVVLCAPAALLWGMRRHALLAALSWSLMAAVAALSLSASRPSAEVISLGHVDINETSDTDPREFGYLVTADVGRQSPGWLLLRSSEPLFGFRSLDEWLKFGSAQPSAVLQQCEFRPGALSDVHTCRYSVGPTTDMRTDERGEQDRRPQFVVMSYRRLEDFTSLALLWCADYGADSCRSEESYEEIELRHGWVQHSTLPRGIIIFAALLGWLFAFRMYLRSPSS